MPRRRNRGYCAVVSSVQIARTIRGEKEVAIQRLSESIGKAFDIRLWTRSSSGVSSWEDEAKKKDETARPGSDSPPGFVPDQRPESQ